MRRSVVTAITASVLTLSFTSTVLVRAGDAAPPAAAGAAPYTVQDGNKVDPKTLDGWKTWRALACERCHGAEQEGLVGPSLVNSLKVLSKDDFHTTVINGRPDKGMPPWGASDMMQKNWEGLYAYLKGRSDGQIKPGHLFAIGQ
jgi:mono/diheme cytochrome c family protein